MLSFLLYWTLKVVAYRNISTTAPASPEVMRPDLSCITPKIAFNQGPSFLGIAIPFGVSVRFVT